MDFEKKAKWGRQTCRQPLFQNIVITLLGVILDGSIFSTRPLITASLKMCTVVLNSLCLIYPGKTRALEITRTVRSANAMVVCIYRLGEVHDRRNCYLAYYTNCQLHWARDTLMIMSGSSNEGICQIPFLLLACDILCQLLYLFPTSSTISFSLFSFILPFSPLLLSNLVYTILKIPQLLPFPTG